MKSHIVSETISSVNAQLTEVRSRLMTALSLMIPEGRVIFKKGNAPYVTDEEECVRMKVESVSKEQVNLENETTFDIGDVGTDDLNSLIDAVYQQLYVKN